MFDRWQGVCEKRGNPALPRTSKTGGYADTRLRSPPHSFNVVFSGNSYASGERARDFAVLRAAELCTAAGLGFLHRLASAEKTGSIQGAAIVSNGAFGCSAGNKPYISIDVECVAKAGPSTLAAKAVMSRVCREYELDRSLAACSAPR